MNGSHDHDFVPDWYERSLFIDQVASMYPNIDRCAVDSVIEELMRKPLWFALPLLTLAIVRLAEKTKEAP